MKGMNNICSINQKWVRVPWPTRRNKSDNNQSLWV